MITRIAKIKGFNKVLSGRDLAGIFKDGHVYEVTELMGEIMIRDLGEHAIDENLKPFHHQRLSFIIMNGTHCLTESEYQNQLKAQNK